MGAQLLEAESTKTIDDYGDFRPGEAIQELLPKLDYTKPMEELPLLLVQVTRFSGGGGLCMGIALSHSVADGFAAFHFINTWAKLAREQTLDQHDMPFLDRTVLRCRQPLIPPRFPHPEFKPPPLLLGASDVTGERRKETTVQLLKLTAKQVNKIKKQANHGMEINDSNTLSSGSGLVPFSRFEAVSAHIWRCVSKARQHEYQQPTSVWLVGDVRNTINPPLPPNYLGNAVLPTVTTNVISGEVTSKPLSYTAHKIREAIGLLRQEEYVRSQLDLIESVEQVDSLWVAYEEEGSAEQPFYGNPNMRIVSWMSLPLHRVDFGWGKAVYAGPTTLDADGKVMILPAPSGDGTLLIAIRLQTAHISDFNYFLYHDL